MKLTRHALITTLVLFYLLTAAACFLSDIPHINDYKWDIDYSLWETNQTFLDTISIWSNLFILSLSPAIFAWILKAKRRLVYLAMALPLFWGVVLLMAIYQDSTEFGRLLSDFAKVVYGILFVSILGVAIQLFLILKKIRQERKIEKLEKFQERALRKLKKLNPEYNPKLLEDLLGKHGQALNLLIASHYYEDDEEKQRELTRLALHYAMKEKDSIQQLNKRLLRYSEFPDKE